MANKTFLLVEDTPDLIRLAGFSARSRFPGNEYDFVVAEDLFTAIEVLCDPNRNIVGACIDNGFAAREGGPRIGATSSQIQQTMDELDARRKEGGAGTMLLHFMRTGDLGALSNESAMYTQGIVEEMQRRLGAGFAERLEQLKTCPAIWNSADPRREKIALLRARLHGEEINLDAKEFNDPTALKRGTVEWLDEYTACSDKTFPTIFDSLVAKITEKERNKTEFGLCKKYGYPEGPEAEFSLAVQYQYPAILSKLLGEEKYAREISGARINSAIGMLCTRPDEKILDIVMQFPRFDVNAFYILPMSDPEKAIRPLFEAIHYGVHEVVEKLLSAPKVVVTQDLLDIAKDKGNQKVIDALAKWETALQAGTSVTTDVATLKEVRFGVEHRNAPKITAG